MVCDVSNKLGDVFAVWVGLVSCNEFVHCVSPLVSTSSSALHVRRLKSTIDKISAINCLSMPTL